MTRYWLFKSEPCVWGWENQVERGAAGEEWHGVRNYQARNNMRAMAVGDLGFFYHSVAERQIMGIVRVISAAHPDSTAGAGEPWDCVDIAAAAPLPRPVGLDEIKASPLLSDMALVKQSRLSVQPVRPEEWRLVCAMGGLDARTLEQ